jgi:phage-related protein
MSSSDKPLVWLHGAVRSPPLSQEGRLNAAVLLRRLQRGEHLPMPYSRPMPSVGVRCHELRIVEEGSIWRILYRIDPDAIVILDVYQKKTTKTPQRVIDACRQRLLDSDVG